MRKTKRTLLIGLIIAAAFAAFGIFRETQSVQARISTAPSAMAADSTPTPCPGPSPACYSVAPSDTDDEDCDVRPEQAIGCQNRWPTDPGLDANNNEHFFYLPPRLDTDTSKLLVLLGGADGNAEGISQIVGPVAASQGYHVIGLTYPAANANSCDTLNCYGDAFREVVTGEENPDSDKTTVGDHRQDSIVNRLLRALQWAAAEHGSDGWGQYLTTTGEVDWTKIHLAGMSNGSSHVSFMGTLPQFRDIGRVALFAGPDDGDGGTTEETWDPATYIQQTEVPYYGLVHVLNKAPNADHPRWYRIAKNWVTFGMEGPQNGERVFFDPTPGVTPDFDGAHMLISTDPLPQTPNPTPTPTDAGTTPEEAHESVAHDRYCSKFEPDTESDNPYDYRCSEFEGATIGYEPAWRCILGAGDISLSSAPIADAGPNQIVECEGGGGANVNLDGSGTRDLDCGVLTYTWTGSFVAATGRKPTVFLPVGTHLVNLEVKDEWNWSDSKTVLITVQDTEPPTISCPADIVVEPTCASGAVANYTAPVGDDICAEAITTRTAGLASGSIFPIGTTTVTYTATDAANNTASCSFAVKVLTAAEVIQDLISRVQALQPPLSGQQAQGLRSKLSAALVAIDSGQKNVACNKLNDFINQVQTYINNGKLTSAQGQPLIDSAAHVRNTLGCTAFGCT